MTRPMLSVFIIAYNEEKNIERCLKSVAWADEVVIVDGFSSDRTVGVCRKFTDKVYQKAFKNYSDQKNYAASLTAGDWLLSLDADEEVTAPLKEEILGVVRNGQSQEAYRIPRRSFIFGREFRFTGTQDDRPVRFFRRGKGNFLQPIHEELHVNGDTGSLGSFLNHFTYGDISSYLRRFNRYTSMEAAYLREGERRLRFSDLWLRPLGMFFRLYFWKWGLRDGLQGFFFSVLSAFYVFMKYAKAWELNGQKT